MFSLHYSDGTTETTAGEVVTTLINSGLATDGRGPNIKKYGAVNKDSSFE